MIRLIKLHHKKSDDAAVKMKARGGMAIDIWRTLPSAATRLTPSSISAPFNRRESSAFSTL
jgi:hypothetical protein